jgi:hypothetical protein
MKTLDVMFPVIKSLESISAWVLKKGDIPGRDAFITDAITQVTAPTVNSYLDNLEDPKKVPLGDELERQMTVIIRSGSTYGSQSLFDRIQRVVGGIIAKGTWKDPRRKKRMEDQYKAWLERAKSVVPTVEALKVPK